MNRERSDKMEEEKKEKKGFFARLVSGLTKTRDNIVSGIDSVFHGFSHIDDDFYEEIEEILIMGDLGVHATEAILDKLKERVKEEKIKELSDMLELEEVYTDAHRSREIFEEKEKLEEDLMDVYE